MARTETASMFTVCVHILNQDILDKHKHLNIVHRFNETS